mmetsp:Transcript_25920/g.48309  ORF Transcript_25920/g.48309 Transcript_25920/m.48309 type:complete len:255 (+) Transcript_25920:728-1492(+)
MATYIGLSRQQNGRSFLVGHLVASPARAAVSLACSLSKSARALPVDGFLRLTFDPAPRLVDCTNQRRIKAPVLLISPRMVPVSAIKLLRPQLIIGRPCSEFERRGSQSTDGLAVMNRWNDEQKRRHLQHLPLDNPLQKSHGTPMQVVVLGYVQACCPSMVLVPVAIGDCLGLSYPLLLMDWKLLFREPVMTLQLAVHPDRELLKFLVAPAVIDQFFCPQIVGPDVPVRRHRHEACVVEVFSLHGLLQWNRNSGQ